MAFVGVTGVGNSTVARALKKRLGWFVIEKNKIRVILREKGRGFTPELTDKIYYGTLGSVLKKGGNAILDSDFVERPKRKKLEKFARRFRARVVYVHFTCARDVMLERVMHGRYSRKTDIFENSVIAVREHMWRLLWHYRWSEARGGNFSSRGLGIQFIAEIDTTTPRVWQKKVRIVAEKLKKM